MSKIFDRFLFTGPQPSGRGSVGAPSPARGIRHTAYGCGLAALCFCGEAGQKSAPVFPGR
ncbi:MAG: hypothetical protein ACR2L2_16005 [Acidobacteriota bacterium]